MKRDKSISEPSEVIPLTPVIFHIILAFAEREQLINLREKLLLSENSDHNILIINQS